MDGMTIIALVVVVAIIVVGGFAVYSSLKRSITEQRGNPDLEASLRADLDKAQARIAELSNAASAQQKQHGEIAGLYSSLKSAHDALGEQHRKACEERDETDRQLQQARIVATRLQDTVTRTGQDLTLRTSERDENIRDLKVARESLEDQTLAARTAQSALNTMTGERDTLRRERGDAIQARDEALKALAGARERETEAVANLKHAAMANEEMKTFLQDAQQKLSAAFTELAGKAFGERTAQMEQQLLGTTNQSKADIEALLKPVAERLHEFRQRVDQVYGEEAKERSQLVGAIGQLRDMNQHIANTAEDLTRALKGSSKVRGDWGELMLDSVLSSSGLIAGQQYVIQESIPDENGQHLRPDVIVNLPDQRRVVVDAKVNLVAWQEAMNSATPEAHQDALRRHAVALRQHIKDLGAKNYPKGIGDKLLEITIAFVPIEGALSAALGIDLDLQTYAFERRVALATPNTLMSILTVVERLWTKEKIQKQAQEIADAGGLVLDALTNFLGAFERVGKNLSQATTAFDDAKRTLSESQQAVVPRARRLAELGARGKKALPKELQPDVVGTLLLGSEPVDQEPAQLALGNSDEADGA